MHGTQDDNVHIRHSLELSAKLIQEGVHFRQMVGTFNTHTEKAKAKTYWWSISVTFSIVYFIWLGINPGK